jgi:uncharacterized protein YodC (DUF2158 family)
MCLRIRTEPSRPRRHIQELAYPGHRCLAVQYRQQKIAWETPVEFQKGQKVVLKSGGPVMTVIRVEKDEAGTHVFCDWFTKSHTRKSGHFPPEALDFVEL